MPSRRTSIKAQEAMWEVPRGGHHCYDRDVGASTHAYHDPEQVRSRAAWARLAGILRRSGVMNPLPPNYKNSLVQEPRLSEEVAAAGIARLP